MQHPASAGRYAARRSGGLADGRIQQYPCHSGTNQRWEHQYWGAGGGIKLAAANANNRCLGGEGAPSNAVRAVTQESCSGASDQRWYYWWR